MKAILTVDAGSSSVKCTAYAICSEQASIELGVRAKRTSNSGEGGNAKDENKINKSSSALCPAVVEAIHGAHASRSVRAICPNTGQIENLNQLLQAVDDCVSDVLSSVQQQQEQTQRNYTFVAVGFSSFSMNLVGMDVDGEPVGKEATISYACNTNEVVEEVERLKRELGEENQRVLYQNSGTPLHSSYALAQLRVLYNTHPSLCGRIHAWQSISNLVIARWTGQKEKGGVRDLAFSYSEASWTGLLNFRTCRYEELALSLLPSDSCREALPRHLCDFDECLSEWASEYASKWPQLSHACLYLGLGDGASANIGSKCCVPYRIACTVGTSAAARVCIPFPLIQQQEQQEEQQAQNAFLQVPHGLFCYRIDRHHILLGGALTDGGSVIEWIRQLLNLEDPQDFDACMQRVETALARRVEMIQQDADASCILTTVPFLSGERSTGYRGGTTGVMYGLTRETTALDLVQSCLEGVTLRLGAIVQRIQQVLDNARTATTTATTTVVDPQIIVSGKALEVNQVWRQMISDCTGLNVFLDTETVEGTSRGVALMLRTVLADDSSPPSLVHLPLEAINTQHRHQPEPESTAYWKQLKVQQDNVISAVSPLYPSHGSIQ